MGLKSTVGSVAKLAYHLCAHPATALNAGAVAAAVGGMALLSLVMILRIKSAGVTQWSLAAALGSGLAVVVSSSLVIRGFDPLSLNYNIWILPGFYLLLAAGVIGGPRHLRRVAAVGAILLLGPTYIRIFNWESTAASSPMEPSRSWRLWSIVSEARARWR